MDRTKSKNCCYGSPAKRWEPGLAAGRQGGAAKAARGEERRDFRFLLWVGAEVLNRDILFSESVERNDQTPTDSQTRQTLSHDCQVPVPVREAVCKTGAARKNDKRTKTKSWSKIISDYMLYLKSSLSFLSVRIALQTLRFPWTYWGQFFSPALTMISWLYSRSTRWSEVIS